MFVRQINSKCISNVSEPYRTPLSPRCSDSRTRILYECEKCFQALSTRFAPSERVWSVPRFWLRDVPLSRGRHQRERAWSVDSTGSVNPTHPNISLQKQNRITTVSFHCAVAFHHHHDPLLFALIHATLGPLGEHSIDGRVVSRASTVILEERYLLFGV